MPFTTTQTTVSDYYGSIAWTKGAGWVATGTPGDERFCTFTYGGTFGELSTTPTWEQVQANSDVKLTWTVTITAGGITPCMGTVTGTRRTTSGTYTEYLTTVETCGPRFVPDGTDCNAVLSTIEAYYTIPLGLTSSSSTVASPNGRPLHIRASDAYTDSDGDGGHLYLYAGSRDGTGTQGNIYLRAGCDTNYGGVRGQIFVESDMQFSGEYDLLGIGSIGSISFYSGGFSTDNISLTEDSYICPDYTATGEEATNHLGIGETYRFGVLWTEQIQLFGRRTHTGSELITNGDFATDTVWVWDPETDWKWHIGTPGFAPNYANFIKVYGHYLYPNIPTFTQSLSTTKADTYYRIYAATTFTGGSGGDVVVGLGNYLTCPATAKGAVGQSVSYVDVLCEHDGDDFFCYPSGFDWQSGDQHVAVTYISMYELKLVSVIDNSNGAEWDLGDSPVTTTSEITTGSFTAGLLSQLTIDDTGNLTTVYAYGTESLANPTFTSDTKWTYGSSWDISGGMLSKFTDGTDTASQLIVDMTVPLIYYGIYRLVITPSMGPGGGISGIAASCGGNDFGLVPNGLSATFIFTVYDDTLPLTLTPTNTGRCGLVSISLKQITGGIINATEIRGGYTNIQNNYDDHGDGIFARFCKIDDVWVTPREVYAAQFMDFGAGFPSPTVTICDVTNNVLLTVSAGIQVNSVDKTSLSASQANTHLSLRGYTDTTKELTLGIDTTDNYGFIQARKFGTSYYDLRLQHLGGTVIVGTKIGSGGQMYIFDPSVTSFTDQSSSYTLQVFGGTHSTAYFENNSIYLDICSGTYGIYTTGDIVVASNSRFATLCSAASAGNFNDDGDISVDLVDGEHAINAIGDTLLTGRLNVVANLQTEIAPSLTTGNWTLGTGWRYLTDPDCLDKNADGTGYIVPTIPLTIAIGTTYKIVITVSAISGGTVTYTLGGGPGTILSSEETYTDYITATTTGTLVIANTVTGLRVTITDISVKALANTAGDVTIDGNLVVRSPASFLASITVTKGIYDNAVAPSLAINLSDRQLINTSGKVKLQWQTGYCYGEEDSQSIDWSARYLKDDGGTSSICWRLRKAYKSDGSTYTIDWENRRLSEPWEIMTGLTCTGYFKPRTTASDPQDATPANRPTGVVPELVHYAGKLYFCTNASTPTWEKITSS